MAFLLAALGQKRTAVKSLLKFGAIAVNGEVVTQFNHPLAAGDVVTVSDLKSAVAVERLQAARIHLIFEDDALLAVDKPAGLLTVATDRAKIDTLFFRLNKFLRGRDGPRATRPQVVHRIDQETSGLVLFAKSAAVKEKLQAEWPSVTKTYYAIVAGTPDPPQGKIESYLVEHNKSLKVHASDRQTPGAKLATTHYRVLQSRNELSLLEIGLETGRKHQIRVHLAELGHPVVGDKRYEAASDPCNRLALHAGRLALPHPVTGEPLQLAAPLPRAMGRLFPEAAKKL